MCMARLSWAFAVAAEAWAMFRTLFNTQRELATVAQHFSSTQWEPSQHHVCSCMMCSFALFSPHLELVTHLAPCGLTGGFPLWSFQTRRDSGSGGRIDALYNEFGTWFHEYVHV